VSLSYVDAQYPGSQQLVLQSQVDIDTTSYAAATPMDPTTDASATHVVSVIGNGTAGAIAHVHDASTLALLANFSLASLAPGGPCALAPGGQGQVLYDHVADQWVLLQATAPPYNGLCLFVTLGVGTSPAAAQWRLYQFTLAQYPGEPKLAMFGDLYVVTAAGAMVYFIERQPILNAQLNTRFFGTLVPGNTSVPVTPLDNDAGPQPLYATAQGGTIVARHFESYLELHHYTNVNFALGTFGLNYTRIELPMFNASTCVDNCVHQPAPGPLLPSLKVPLAARLVYRQVPTPTSFTQSMVGSFAVIVAQPNIYGVFWFELRALANGPNWALYQTSVLASNVTNHWTSALTMDGQGTLVVAASRASNGVAPSLVASWRVATDVLNTTSEPLALGPAGTGYAPVWGRYHGMSAAPVADGNGIFFTIGQVAPKGIRLTRLGMAPLHMLRTWTATDNCAHVQWCTQTFTSA
jgi:hypothetical protein